MKLDRGSTDMVEFPIEETDKLMDAMELAEKTDDLAAFKWCFRRLMWLWQEGDVTGDDKYCYTVDLFNKSWEEMLKNDPAPESITAIINRKDEPEPEPPAAADAEKALDTVKAFFEENLGGKSFRAACVSLDVMRDLVKTAEAGE